MLRSYALVVCAGMVLPSAGCGGGDSSREPVASFSLENTTYQDVDILFVIDNTVNLDPFQDALLGGFESFTSVLENLEGGLPNLHLGVISTDSDTGGWAYPDNCVGSHDNGALQAAATGACTPPDGAFISDVDDGTGGRTKNYTGTLAESFSCIARLGSTGCSWQQPLESMKRALDGSNPGNAGFLRPDAVLAVIFFTNDDDCSASDVNLYNCENTDLGECSIFRCFEYGVKCDPDTPREVGLHEDCGPREDSAYVHGVDEYVSFLKSLKDDPQMIVAAGIFGDLTPVGVANDGAHTFLGTSCESQPGFAYPAIRLASFVDSFPGRSVEDSICQPIYTDPLTATAEKIGQAMSDDLHFAHCLDQMPSDTDPETAGLQADCEVVEIDADDSETQLAACDRPANPPSSTNLPCYVLDETAGCSASDTMVETFHATAPATGASLAVRCRID